MAVVGAWQQLNEQRKQLATAEVETAYKKDMEAWNNKRLIATDDFFKQMSGLFSGWGGAPAPTVPGFGGFVPRPMFGGDPE